MFVIRIPMYNCIYILHMYVVANYMYIYMYIQICKNVSIHTSVYVYKWIHIYSDSWEILVAALATKVTSIR